MTMPTEEGRYKADVISSAGAIVGQNNLCAIKIDFRITEQASGDPEAPWWDILDQNLTIQGTLFIEKRPDKGGGPIEFVVGMLRDSFGWDGQTPFWFDTAELPPCQIVLRESAQHGMEVAFVNPIDATARSSTPHATEDQKRAVMARLGPKLRAIAGGVSRPAQQPKAPLVPPPAQQEPAPEAPQPAPPGTVTTASETLAWNKCGEMAVAKKLTEKEKNDEWFKTIADLCGDVDRNKVTTAQWFDITAVFDESMKAYDIGDDIPF